MIFLSTLSLRRATFCPTCQWRRSVISIHALLAESDGILVFCGPQGSGNFYPRSPCGERPEIFLDLTYHQNFYPRSPCGERPWARGSRVTYVEISIHALLAESDHTKRHITALPFQFLSTLSLRRATWKKSLPMFSTRHFYPRSPCGERRHFISAVVSYNIFLSTLSLRRATGCLMALNRLLRISIHALLAESDTRIYS